MANDYYNPSLARFSRGLTASGAHITDELQNIMAGFAALPAPAVLASLEASSTLNYTWLAWADSADGTSNFSNSDPANRDYVGYAVNKSVSARSSNPADYTWQRVRGTDGTAGTDGEDGDYVDYRYVRSRAQPARPGATDDPPAGSSTSVPAGTDPLWMTQSVRAGDGTFLTPWTTYVRHSALPAPVTYVNTDTYYPDESVFFGGGTYIRTGTGATTGQAPSGTAQATAYWNVISAPGQAGAPATPPSAFSATIDLTNATALTNLRTIADANGYTGMSDATVTFRVPAAVTLGGTSGGGHAVDSGTWPDADYTITLSFVVQNGGIVRGGGGEGGAGGVGNIAGGAGGAGGDAVYLRTAMNVTIDAGGELRGGGGAGGGGAGAVISGEYFDGGGGGGGYPNGAGSGTGASGTTSGGGAGGTSPPGAAGGAGGAAATSGSSGATNATGTPGAGGAAGYAVRKNGKTSTVTNNGTMSGSAA